MRFQIGCGIFLTCAAFCNLLGSAGKVFRVKENKITAKISGGEKLSKGDIVQFLRKGNIVGSAKVQSIAQTKIELELISGEAAEGNDITVTTPAKRLSVRSVREKATKADAALLKASEEDDIEGVKAALRARAFVDAVDQYERTSLMLASAKSSNEIVVTLLKAKADVNASDFRGMTPLMFAADANRSEIVKTLLIAGADPNAKMVKHAEKPYMTLKPQLSYPDWEARLITEMQNKADEPGFSPLIFAAKTGQAGSVSILLDSKPQINALDNFGNSALIYAAWTGNTENLRLLIKAGADVNVQGLHGYSALAFAVRRGQIDNVMVLLQANAYVNAKIQGGKSMLQLARESGHAEIITRLRNMGARE